MRKDSACGLSFVAITSVAAMLLGLIVAAVLFVKWGNQINQTSFANALLWLEGGVILSSLNLIFWRFMVLRIIRRAQAVVRPLSIDYKIVLVATLKVCAILIIVRCLLVANFLFLLFLVVGVICHLSMFVLASALIYGRNRAGSVAMDDY